MSSSHGVGVGPDSSSSDKQDADANKKPERELPPVNKEATAAGRDTPRGAGLLFVAETSTGCRLSVSYVTGPKDGEELKGGANSLDELERKAEEKGRRKARELAKLLESGVCADGHLQDQFLVLQAMM